MKLDETDIKILRLLQENGKITNVQLSTDVNLSPAPTLERVKKLESLGYITSYHAKLNPEKIGLQLIVFVEVGFNLGFGASLDTFIEQLKGYEEVTECYHTTGEYDLLLKVFAPNINSYQTFVMEKLIHSRCISKINSKIVLSVSKDTLIYPLTPIEESIKKRINIESSRL